MSRTKNENNDMPSKAGRIAAHLRLLVTGIAVTGGCGLMMLTDSAFNPAHKVVKAEPAKAVNTAEKTVPELPEVPDYTEAISKLDEARVAYENSVQGLKQVTAPSDEFVMERLQRIETITAMGAVTEDHDPNGMLNKQGGYIGCIYFTDTQVDRSLIYIEDGLDGVIDVGTEGGGAIEVFATAEEANVRNDYLATFDGMGAGASGASGCAAACCWALGRRARTTWWGPASSGPPSTSRAPSSRT